MTPSPGLALVFNHDVLHEGAEVVSGFKHILRTEVMFKRVAGAADRAYQSSDEVRHERSWIVAMMHMMTARRGNRRKCTHITTRTHIHAYTDNMQTRTHTHSART